MTLIKKRMPVILLAILMGLALSLVPGLWQKAYAATDNNYYVTLEPLDGQYTALPGHSIRLSAEVLHDYEGYDLEDQDYTEYVWELDEGDELFATVEPDGSYSNLATATVTFDQMAEGESPYEQVVNVKLSVYVNGKRVAKDNIYLSVSDNFYQLDPQVLYTTVPDVYDEVGPVIPKVTHYTARYEGDEYIETETPVDGVQYTIEPNVDYDPALVEVTGDAETGYTFKRLSGEFVGIWLNANWQAEGTDYFDCAWYRMSEIPTDLNEYWTDVTIGDGDWRYYVEDDAQITEADMHGDDIHVSVTCDNFVLDRDKYTLKAEKCEYNEETGEETYTEVPFPLGLNGEDSVIYRITAIADETKGYTGQTEEDAGYFELCSKYGLTGYGVDINLDSSYIQFLDEAPWFRYEVKPGTILRPAVVLNDETLVRGTDYTEEYVNDETGDVYDSFPRDAGLYTLRITGLAPYHGVNDTTTIKVGYTNYFSASAKTVKAKANKKTTFAAKKAFKVSSTKGEVTYEKKSGNKKIKVASNGKVTVAKGLKKGKTYKVKVLVTDSGSSTFLSATKTVTLKVKIQ